MTTAELAELRALCEAATPGKWEHRTALDDGTPWNDVIAIHPDDWVIVVPDTGRAPEESHAVEEADAAFIAASRTAVPRLLDRVEELAALLTRATNYLQSANDLLCCDDDECTDAQNFIDKARAALAGKVTDV